MVTVGDAMAVDKRNVGHKEVDAEQGWEAVVAVVVNVRLMRVVWCRCSWL